MSYKKLFQKSRPEWGFMLIGSIGAAIFGAYPFLFGLSLGGIFDVSM